MQCRSTPIHLTGKIYLPESPDLQLHSGVVNQDLKKKLKKVACKKKLKKIKTRVSAREAFIIIRVYLSRDCWSVFCISIALTTPMDSAPMRVIGLQDSLALQDECIICTQQLGPTNFTCFQCKKSFHLDCISRWARHASTCPLCRAELPPALFPPPSPGPAGLRGNMAVSFVVADDADSDMIHHALRLAFSI